ncbi:MAG: hypothetical protein KR126chlam1_01404 [Chlamydiae bacterium]|nr:hypothetical protein [Chlamydiota bacterium]
MTLTKLRYGFVTETVVKPIVVTIGVFWIGRKISAAMHDFETRTRISNTFRNVSGTSDCRYLLAKSASYTGVALTGVIVLKWMALSCIEQLKPYVSALSKIDSFFLSIKKTKQSEDALDASSFGDLDKLVTKINTLFPFQYMLVGAALSGATLLIVDLCRSDSTPEDRSVRIRIGQAFWRVVGSPLLIAGIRLSAKITPWIALRQACNHHYFNLAHSLVEGGLDVNSVDFGHETLLHHACKEENWALAHLLLELGANVDAETYDGRTPLFYAFDRRDEEIIRLLHEKGGKNVQNGNTLFHLACISASLEDAQFALQTGADINALDANGDTSLHLACRHEKGDLVHWLVTNGADGSILNSEQKTPRHLVEDNSGHPTQIPGWAKGLPHILRAELDPSQNRRAI